MLDDDPLRLDSAEVVVLVAGSGVLEDDARCDCVCGCDRTAIRPDDLCLRCQVGDHESTDPTGSTHARAARPIFTADPTHLRPDLADPAHLRPDLADPDHLSDLADPAHLRPDLADLPDPIAPAYAVDLPSPGVPRVPACS